MGTLTNDTALWLAFKKGDTQAFRLLYQQHYAGLYHYALKITHQPDLSQDCVQNLFIYLWNCRTHLSDIVCIKPYLFKALRRDLHRLTSAEGRNETGREIPEVLCFSPEEIVIEDETRHYLQQQIAQLLNELPARQKEAVYLKYYEELDYKAIAQIMGIHYQSVINLLYKALTYLKKEENRQKLSELFSARLACVAGSLLLIF